jgi:putative phosphoribosyl transferase
MGVGRVNISTSTIEKSLKKKLQVKLKNRYAAGRILSDLLKDDLKSVLSNRWQHQILVLGIPRGGVVTASAVAKELCADFEFVASNRLVASQDEEITIGAVVENSDLYLNDDVVEALDISNEYILKEKAKALELIESRRSKYKVINPMDSGLKIGNKIIILIDDGAASGATLTAALRSLKTYEQLSAVLRRMNLNM